eukprot:gene4577-14758_t
MDFEAGMEDLRNNESGDLEALEAVKAESDKASTMAFEAGPKDLHNKKRDDLGTLEVVKEEFDKTSSMAVEAGPEDLHNKKRDDLGGLEVAKAESDKTSSMAVEAGLKDLCNKARDDLIALSDVKVEFLADFFINIIALDSEKEAFKKQRELSRAAQGGKDADLHALLDASFVALCTETVQAVEGGVWKRQACFLEGRAGDKRAAAFLAQWEADFARDMEEEQQFSKQWERDYKLQLSRKKEFMKRWDADYFSAVSAEREAAAKALLEDSS